MSTYLRLEILRTLRRPAFLGYAIGFPVAFYLLFTTVFKGGGSVDGQPAAAYAMASMALYGTIIASLPGVGARIAVERTKGWTRQLALSPMRPAQYLAIKVITASIVTVPVILLILALGRIVNGVSLPVGTWFQLGGLLWLGSLPFVALGVAIGYAFRDELANAVCMIGMFLLSIVGGLWVPVGQFPAWLRHIAEVTPAYRAGQLGWSTIGVGHVTAGGVGILVAWGLLFAAIAAWRYRRSARRGRAGERK